MTVKPTKGVIGPGANTFSEYFPIERDTINEVIANKKAFYIWCFVSYNHAMDPSDVKETELCHRMYIRGPVGDDLRFFHQVCQSKAAGPQNRST